MIDNLRTGFQFRPLFYCDAVIFELDASMNEDLSDEFSLEIFNIVDAFAKKMQYFQKCIPRAAKSK